MKYRQVFYNIHYTFVKYFYNKHPNTTVTRSMDILFVIYLFQFVSPLTAHDNRSIVSHDYYHPLVLILRSKQFTHRTTSTTDRTSRYLSHPKATSPSVRISVGLNVCVGAQFRVSAGKHTSASPARCISHATPVFGSSSSSSPRSPLDLSSPSHPLLLDRGHGPRLNAILTELEAHHLTDISLYESDNGVPPPPTFPSLPLQPHLHLHVFIQQHTRCSEQRNVRSKTKRIQIGKGRKYIQGAPLVIIQSVTVGGRFFV